MSSNQNRIRDIILEEGIEARNVINWRVQPKQTNERPSTGDANNNNNRGELTNINKSKGEKQVFSGSNLTTASMRLWKLIFENVLRSVDELHHFCEDEQSVELAEQGFQFCLSSCRDFAQLVQKFEKEKEKEKDKDKDKEKIELIMPPLSTKHRAVVGTPNTSSTPSAVLLPASAPDAEAAAMVEPTVTTTAVTTTAVVVTVNADANSISSTSPSPAESSCLKMPKLRAAAVPFVPRSVVQPSHQLNEQPQEEKEVHDNLTTSTQLLNNSTVADPPIISTESKLLLSNDNDSKTNTASNEASENIMNSNRPKSPLKVAVAIMSKSTRTTTNTTTVSNSTPATKASKLSVINKVSLNKTRAPQTSVNKPTRSETHSTQSKRDFNTQSQVESKQRDDRSVSCSRRSQSEDQSRCDSSTSVDSLDALDLSEIEQLEVVRASEAVWAEAEAWIEAEVLYLSIYLSI